MVFCDASNLVLKFVHLTSGVLTLVSADTAMDHLVEWVLRMLLMEDVLFTIFPVREISSIMTVLVNGLLLLKFLTNARLSASTVGSIMDGFSSGGELHFMGVNDLSLFLHVESFLVVFHDRL